MTRNDFEPLLCETLARDYMRRYPAIDRQTVRSIVTGAVLGTLQGIDLALMIAGAVDLTGPQTEPRIQFEICPHLR